VNEGCRYYETGIIPSDGSATEAIYKDSHDSTDNLGSVRGPQADPQGVKGTSCYSDSIRTFLCQGAPSDRPPPEAVPMTVFRRGCANDALMRFFSRPGAQSVMKEAGS
jgi:hypothetical protein